jgi:hypothetical protein
LQERNKASQRFEAAELQFKAQIAELTEQVDLVSRSLFVGQSKLPRLG